MVRVATNGHRDDCRIEGAPVGDGLFALLGTIHTFNTDEICRLLAPGRISKNIQRLTSRTFPMRAHQRILKMWFTCVRSLLKILRVLCPRKKSQDKRTNIACLKSGVTAESSDLIAENNHCKTLPDEHHIHSSIVQNYLFKLLSCCFARTRTYSKDNFASNDISRER